MEEVTLTATERSTTGKGAARKLRGEGKVPGVMYKGGEPTRSLTVEVDKLQGVLDKGRNTLITLKLDNVDHMVMIKELQRDPVASKLLHVDFVGIDINKPIDVEIAVELVGTPTGVTAGGILQHIMRSILVRCLPTAIPKQLNVDVSQLELNDSIQVKDVAAPEGAEFMEEPDAPIASVVAPALEVTEEPAEGEEEGEAPAEGGEKTAAEKPEEKEE